MHYGILIFVLILVGYVYSRADKFKISSKVRIVEEVDGWAAYSKTRDSITYFIDEWNDSLDIHGEVTLYDFPGVYWNYPLSKFDIYECIPNGNGYMYKLRLPDVCDDWGYKRRMKENKGK